MAFKMKCLLVPMVSTCVMLHGWRVLSLYTHLRKLHITPSLLPPSLPPHTRTPLSSLSTQGGSQKSSRVLSCFYLSLCACPVNSRHLGFPVISAPPPPFMKSFLLCFRLGAQDRNLTHGWSFYAFLFPSGLEHLD